MKMISIYIDKKDIENILKNKKESPLAKMMTFPCQLCLYNCDCSDTDQKLGAKRFGSTSAPLDRNHFTNSPLAHSNITLSNANSLISHIKRDNSAITDYSDGIFFLKETEEVCCKLQKDYGVLCIPSGSTDSEVLTDEGYFDSFPNEVNSWSVFNVSDVYPSNSITLIDRYFFSREGGGGRFIDDSLYNLKQIFEAFLPKSLKVPFDVLLIINDDTLKDKYKHYAIKDGKEINFEYITKEVNKLRSSFSKKYHYKLNIEIWSLTNDSYGKEDTHNRRILSQYYYFKAEHKLRAFNKNHEAVEQDIEGKSLYGEGLYSSRKKPGLLSHQKTVDNFKKILSEIQEGENMVKTYKYSINGEVKPFTATSITNRLFQKKKMEHKYFFKPWIGPDYSSQKNKILVVGVSHHCPHSKFKKEEGCENFCICTNCACNEGQGNSKEFINSCPFPTQEGVSLSNETENVVRKFINDGANTSFKAFTDFAQMYFHEKNEDFSWKNIAFVNYIQDFESESRGNHFKKDYFPAFEEYLDELTPDILIIWGSALGDELKRIGFKKETDNNDYNWVVNRNGKEIKCINTYHPCYTNFIDGDDGNVIRKAFDWAFNKDKCENNINSLEEAKEEKRHFSN